MLKRIFLFVTLIMYIFLFSGCFYIDLQLGEKQGGGYEGTSGDLSDATIPADLSYFP